MMTEWLREARARASYAYLGFNKEYLVRFRVGRVMERESKVWSKSRLRVAYYPDITREFVTIL